MIKPWRTLSSRTLVRDQWLTLRADVCELPSGAVLDPYYVVERPSWVALVALTDQGEAVLTREFRQGAGLVALGLPGGIIDAGESAIDCAARELMEETGYACRQWVQLGAFYANWKNHTNQLHVLLGLGAEQRGAPTLDVGEDIETVLTPWAQWLAQMLTPPGQAYYVAASLLADRWMANEGVSPPR